MHQLANHVIGELRWIPPLMRGRSIAEVGDELSGDLLGDDAAAAWRSAQAEAMASLNEPGAMERTVQLSFGPTSAEAYIEQVTADLVIHTWDLARGIHGDERLDDSLVAAASRILEPQIEAWRSGGALGPAVDAGHSADAQTRFLAATGRDAART